MSAGPIVLSGPPTVTVRLGWDTDMDMTSLPSLSVWQFLIDAVPKSASAQVWFGPRFLDVSYSGTDPTVTGFLNLIATDPGLRCALGAVAQSPQSVQFFP